jgi:hypothetical protein
MLTFLRTVAGASIHKEMAEPSIIEMESCMVPAYDPEQTGFGPSVVN